MTTYRPSAAGTVYVRISVGPYSTPVQNRSLANYKQPYVRVCNARSKNRWPQRLKHIAADLSTSIGPDFNHDGSEQILFSLGLMTSFGFILMSLQVPGFFDVSLHV